MGRKMEYTTRKEMLDLFCGQKRALKSDLIVVPDGELEEGTRVFS